MFGCLVMMLVDEVWMHDTHTHIYIYIYVCMCVYVSSYHCNLRMPISDDILRMP